MELPEDETIQKVRQTMSPLLTKYSFSISI